MRQLQRRSLLRAAAGTFFSPRGALAKDLDPLLSGNRKPVRYVIGVLLTGGIDAALSTDVKTRSEVERWVDGPQHTKTVFENNGRPYGELLRPIQAHLSEMAIVNGVKVATVSHGTGIDQFLAMRRNVTYRVPSIFSLIGRHRDSQVLAGMDLGSFTTRTQMLLCPRAPDREEKLRRLASLLRRAAQSLGASGSEGRRILRARYEESARLLEALPACEQLRTSPSLSDAQLGAELAVWALQNDLTRTFILSPPSDIFDSHNLNLRRQRAASSEFLPGLDYLLRQLKERKNAYGTLADNTLVVIGSELGRFPRVNALEGKDHLPEVPLMFWGAGINTADGRGAIFGQTGRAMDAQPVSLKTGRPASSGTLVTLDDVGRTLLELTGCPEPSLYGYTGRRLDFLVRQ